MLTQPNVDALNHDRQAVLNACKTMRALLDRTEADLAEPIVPNTPCISRGNLTRCLACHQELAVAIARYDASVAARL